MRHRAGRRAAAAEGGRDARPEERAAAADPGPVGPASRGDRPDECAGVPTVYPKAKGKGVDEFSDLKSYWSEENKYSSVKVPKT
ncbi:hypothetical protein ACWC5I_29895, partial [Kitasatospora sp. NPDC001574]